MRYLHFMFYNAIESEKGRRGERERESEREMGKGDSFCEFKGVFTLVSE